MIWYIYIYIYIFPHLSWSFFFFFETGIHKEEIKAEMGATKVMWIHMCGLFVCHHEYIVVHIIIITMWSLLDKCLLSLVALGIWEKIRLFYFLVYFSPKVCPIVLSNEFHCSKSQFIYIYIYKVFVWMVFPNFLLFANLGSIDYGCCIYMILLWVSYVWIVELKNWDSILILEINSLRYFCCTQNVLWKLPM